jgi:HD-GYP domain-containing protein (c-di-GMP phosphodiesterase class II)
MKREETRRLGELFNRVKENWYMRQEITSFGKYLKGPEWVIFPGVPESVKDLKHMLPPKCLPKRMRSSTKIAAMIKKIHNAVKNAKRSRALQQFCYSENFFGLCHPLLADGELFGFILLCGLKKPMLEDLLKIFIAFTDTVVRETQKELELDELNKTIRPRAIALSTVHTVHRLMSPTLTLSELLDRIARLSLQVMRANRCSIKLLSKSRKMLLPMTTIDLRKEKTKLKKVEIGRYAPGRAVKKGTVIRGKNYLATPLVDEDIIGVITLYDRIDGKDFTQFDEEIMKTLAEQSAIAIRNTRLFQEQEELTLSSIKCIAQLLETRPHGVKHPEKSFLKIIYLLGRKFNMNETEIKMLQYAGMLHDAGKISVPEKVLAKRGELTGSEIDIIRAHPMKGAMILSRIKPLKTIGPVILCHHENYDGTGYPKGLKGKEIPLGARILAVVVSFEAMVTEKPYRRAMTINEAIKELKKNSGTQFDPKVVDAFIEMVTRKDVRNLLQKELA